ncbi:swr1 complex component [Teratosphaeriaceae sp. CCFEE 6253]|nr:swr1 complex component [Teratosphaeriaceae sp. CCFEE 6253]
MSATSDASPRERSYDATYAHATTPPPPPDDTLLDAFEDSNDVPAVSRPGTAIKLEDDSNTSQLDVVANTATSLRPAPRPSSRRRESEAGETATTQERADQPNKKRKRVPSPPWQFGTVETTTVKTADGRRISARFNPSTPGMSESEGQGGRGRSTSQSMAGRSRPPSPPWKKFGAAGPTSLQVNGVRKSGRMNKELAETPKRTSPRQKKQTEKAQEDQKGSVRPASRGGKTVKLEVTAEVRPPSSAKPRRSLSPNSRIAELHAQIAALQPTRSFPPVEATVQAVEPSPPKRVQKRRPSSGAPPETNLQTMDAPSNKSSHKRKRSSDAPQRVRRPSSPTSHHKIQRPSSALLSPTVGKPSPKIRLRLGSGNRPTLPPQHPHAIFTGPAKPPSLNIHQIIEPYELLELQQPFLENERGPPNAEFFRTKNERLAVDEAEVRRKLANAAQSGGILSEGVCSIYRDERQEEPAQQYGHVDHLATQAAFFRSLQLREKNQHRALAKKVAGEAVERWRVMRGPTEDDIRVEEDRIFRLVYKQVVLDVRGKWELVSAHVDQLRKLKWEAEEDARRQERLQEQLEKAEAMVVKQRRRDEVGSEDDESGDERGSETSSAEDMDAEDEEEDMIESESDVGSEDEDEDPADMDQDALADYLRSRDGEPPDRKGLPVDDASGDTGPGLDEMPAIATVAATAATITHDERGTSSDAFLNQATRAASTAAADTAEAVMAAKHADPDGVASPMSDQGQSKGCEKIAALLGSDDEDEDEDGQEDYVPMAASGAEHDGTTSLRTSRNSPPVDVESDDAGINLDDDESVEMYDSDDDMSSSSDEDGSDGAASDDETSGGEVSTAVERKAQNSMLGFLFGDKQIKSAIGLPTPTTSAGGDEPDHTTEPVSDDHLATQAGASKQDDEVDVKPIKLDQMREATPPIEHDVQGSPDPVDSIAAEPAPRSPGVEAHLATTGKQMVPIPTLLRGTLRSYQHAGLDWLASLHRSGINGILADEMGLGKTIQTISLLAHLAEQNDIWETHLVIVPTSVILNWVTEFHKFCPGFRVLGYYGSSEERAIKRRGWVNDPHHEDRDRRGYNVVITSYNVAMQDINAIRNVQWHYLVLDEAHNIRNFHSQRWQSLIRLKTKARLLLTGTPLQNSLTELWSLLTFLTAGDDDPAHGDLEEFLSHWKEPVKEIFDRGVSALSNEAQKVVDQLHVSLRPFLLRRLKSEVEKDLPKKTESVVVCKLSKRQRQLYQEYMGLASTKESLARGNAVSAGRVLLSLRRVCNHPDLFDPRPIQTSYAIELSPVEPFVVKEMLVRRLLGIETKAVPTGLMLNMRESRKKGALKRGKQLSATGQLKRQAQELEQKSASIPDLANLTGCLAMQRLRQRERNLQHLRDCIQLSETALSDGPVYGSDLRDLLTINRGRPYHVTHRRRQPQDHVHLTRAWPALGRRPIQYEHMSDWHLSQGSALQRDVASVERYAEDLHEVITRFAFCTPVATAPTLNQAIPVKTQQLLRANPAYPFESDFAHEARSRTSIVFPDSRLLIYDSGKLQRLSKLLRELQAKNSRSLIFTQMTGTLNILEQFLSLLNLPYLRLDGSTPPERRMLYSSEFNRPDSKYQCMILSSRAGGVGLNLTGASSVIFYDLDWNPQMDRQCMDRAHRIGQVRDVEVFKMVSEKTVEENILKRATQKSLLDQAVIQEGHFTTDHELPASKVGVEEEDGNGVATAIERFLGGGERTANQAIASVEDREDVLAAEAARKEENQDAEEFAEQRSSKHASAAPTPGPSAAALDGEDDEESDHKAHVDHWMVHLMETVLKDVPFVPPMRKR